MKKSINFLVISWVALILLSYFINNAKAKKNQETTALHGARSFFEEVVVSRAWNAAHGGIYVPVTDETQPIPEG